MIVDFAGLDVGFLLLSRDCGPTGCSCSWTMAKVNLCPYVYDKAAEYQASFVELLMKMPGTKPQLHALLAAPAATADTTHYSFVIRSVADLRQAMYLVSRAILLVVLQSGGCRSH